MENQKKEAKTVQKVDFLTKTDKEIFNLTKDQAFQRLIEENVTDSEQMLTKWCRDGDIAAVRIAKGAPKDRGLMISERSLEAFILTKTGKVESLLDDLERLKTDLAKAKKEIRELKAIGVNIVLDDFGIGSSSLNYLKQLHIDRLKIDRTFVQKILKTRSDEVIIEAIMTLAQSMNFKVVAEGVETQTQINFLKKQNCTEAQGYLLCKPLTPADIEIFFKDNLAVQNGSRKSTSRVNRKIKASDS